MVFPWKLVPANESDEVEATITGGSDVDRSKIKFVTADGKGVAAKDDGTKWVLTVPSTEAGKTTCDIFAVYQKSKAKLQTVGKLRVVSYEKQQHTVTLVPIGVDAPNVGEVQKRLNGIYAPYGVEFTVKVDDAIKELEGWKGRAFKLEGNGFFTRENADMAEIRKAYQSAKGSSKDGYYVFVLGAADASAEDKETQAHGAQGDMPRGQQFGYIFGDRATDLGWLLAHELGHGVFTLKHLNEANYAGKSSLGTLPNLMDYTGSTTLAAFQWNVMANPAILTGLDGDDASKAKLSKPIVIDRYKMPGLNRNGTDISDDLTYGYGIKANTQIYTSAMIKDYIYTYSLRTENKTIDPMFSNSASHDPAAPLNNNQSVIDNANNLNRISNTRSKYTKETVFSTEYKIFNTGEMTKTLYENSTEFEIAAEFEAKVTAFFAQGELEANIKAMIAKFKRKEGGIYENAILTNAVKDNHNTLEYCMKLEEYMQFKIKEAKGDISKIEDKKVYFETANDDRLRDNISKTGFSKPTYSDDKLGGLTIALNDIWATEVLLTDFELNSSGKSYKAKYSVTLWDHFGLDKSDMEKLFNIVPIANKAFATWFILQHIYGYKPFITKITFTKEFKGEL